MKKFILLATAAITLISSTTFAVDDIRVDGYLGNETRQAMTDNPELASQFNLNVAGCNNNNVNCGGTNDQVRAFQEAVNAGPPSTPSPGSGGSYQVKLQEPLSGQSAYLSASNGVDLVNQYISMIYAWAASIVGIVAVLIIVVSGIQIIFGGANQELVSSAKNQIMQALLSLVLLFAMALILRTVNPNFFGFA
jgi:hypothetical protein